MQRLARGLRASGHHVCVVAPQPAGRSESVRGHDFFGTPYLCFGMPSRPAGVPLYPWLIACARSRLRDAVRSLLSVETWDAAILTGESACIFEPIRKLCQSDNVKVLPYPVEWFAPSVAGLLGLSWFDQFWMRALTHRKSDGLIGISRLWAEFASRLGKPSVVIPSFSKFADHELPEIVHESHPSFRIVFVGKWAKRELPGTLFKGLKLALDRGVQWELVVVGAAGKATSLSHRLGEWPATRTLKKLPGVSERIRFLGFLPEADLARQMAAADAFVLLRDDTRETRALFPTRLPEYLATGKPVIVSDAGDLALYLKHKQSAYVIPHGARPRELADAIVYIANHSQEAAAIGAGGRAALLESFSQRKLGDKLAHWVEGLGGDVEQNAEVVKANAVSPAQDGPR